MAVLGNPDGDVLYRSQAACADAEEERRCAAEREAQRPVCTRCGQRFTGRCWEEATARGSWKAGDLPVCGACRAGGVDRRQAAAEARVAAAVPDPDPDGGRESGGLRDCLVVSWAGMP